MCGLGVIGDGGGASEGCEILRTKNGKFSILVRRQPSKPIKSVISKPSFLVYLFKRGVCAYGFRGNGERGMVVLRRWRGAHHRRICACRAYFPCGPCILCFLNLYSVAAKTHLSFIVGCEGPAAVVVVNHLACHAAVNADVFTGDKARFLGGEIADHVGDVERMAYAPCEVLRGVCAFVGGIGGVNPTWRNGVYANPSSETRRERVRQGRNATFGRGIALGLGLAHAIARGGDVDNGSAWGEGVLK